MTSRELVGSMMDLSLSMATLGARQLGVMLGEATSQQALGTALRLLQQSAAVACAALPRELGLEWRELASKLEAFECFQQAPALLGLAPGGHTSLEEPLRRAASLGTYRSVWAAEGLGYAHAEGGRLLRDAGLRGLPEGAVLPLQTGAALSFAGRLLATDEARSRDGLARWIAGWEDNALPDYGRGIGGGIAVEALGLVARNLYPHLLPLLHDLLGDVDPTLTDYLWHGVGRGLYFVPTHALPYSASHGRALEKAWSEPLDEGGRCNATAGLAWALTLVNIRTPELLDDVLRRHGWEIAAGEAFAHGVASAVLIWHGIVGLDSHLKAFLTYRPGTVLWRDLVLDPCESALRHSGGLAARFRFTEPRDGGSRP